MKRLAAIVSLVLVAGACQENARHREFKKVRSIFEKACQDGKIDQCMYLGWLHHSVRVFMRKAKTDEAVPMFRYACTKGNAAACLGAKRVTQARKMWHKACGKGELQACIELVATTHDMGERRTAMAEINKQCAANKTDGRACGALADVLHKQDKPRWLELAQTACSRNYHPACARLASRLYRGDKVAMDKQRAHKLWQASCTAGYTPACGQLSLYYIVEKNREKANELIKGAAAAWKKRCYAGSHDGCDVYLRWLARRAPRKRCLAGDPAACADLMTRVRPFANQRERLEFARKR